MLFVSFILDRALTHLARRHEIPRAPDGAHSSRSQSAARRFPRGCRRGMSCLRNLFRARDNLALIVPMGIPKIRAVSRIVRSSSCRRSAFRSPGVNRFIADHKIRDFSSSANVSSGLAPASGISRKEAVSDSDLMLSRATSLSARFFRAHISASLIAIRVSQVEKGARPWKLCRWTRAF